jgi:hypothetical protein
MKTPSRAATRSPVALAKTALSIAKAALPAYSSPFSRKDFTQPQLYACLMLMEFFRTDYRGIIAYLADLSDLRRALGFKNKLPHYSTVFRAKERLGKLRPLNR